MLDACVLYCTARAARGRPHVSEFGVSGLLLNALYCTTELCLSESLIDNSKAVSSPTPAVDISMVDLEQSQYQRSSTSVFPFSDIQLPRLTREVCQTVLLHRIVGREGIGSSMSQENRI